jgi:hypothetical protein
MLYLLIGFLTLQLFIALKKHKKHLRNGTLHEQESQKAFWRAVAIMAVWLLVLVFWPGFSPIHHISVRDDRNGSFSSILISLKMSV